MFSQRSKQLLSFELFTTDVYLEGLSASLFLSWNSLGAGSVLVNRTRRGAYACLYLKLAGVQLRHDNGRVVCPILLFSNFPEQTIQSRTAQLLRLPPPDLSFSKQMYVPTVNSNLHQFSQSHVFQSNASRFLRSEHPLSEHIVVHSNVPSVRTSEVPTSRRANTFIQTLKIVNSVSMNPGKAA